MFLCSLSKNIPHLQHVYDLWSEYNKTKAELDGIMSHEFQPEFSALKQAASDEESETGLQVTLSEILETFKIVTRNLWPIRITSYVHVWSLIKVLF